MADKKKYVITGRQWGTLPSFALWDVAEEFPSYKLIGERTFECTADNLQSAEKWLLKNHPEWWFGCLIKENAPEKECPDFMINAVPEYQENIYDTRDRNEILEHVCKENGLSYVKRENYCLSGYIADRPYFLKYDGKCKVEEYLEAMVEKRNSILKTGADTADKTYLPSADELVRECELAGFNPEEQTFRVTDSTLMDYPIQLTSCDIQRRL